MEDTKYDVLCKIFGGVHKFRLHFWHTCSLELWLRSADELEDALFKEKISIIQEMIPMLIRR